MEVPSENTGESCDEKAPNWMEVGQEWAERCFAHGHGDAQWMRELIASNPNTPSAVLAALAKSDAATLLERIAEHPSTPASILIELADHPSGTVRAAVTENPNCPPELLWHLVRDEDADVRFRIAENPLLSEQLLVMLCYDVNPYVSMRAQRTLARARSASSPKPVELTLRRFRRARRE